MAPSAGDPPTDSTGPPDRQTLRLLERHFAGDSLVGETTIEPNHHELRSLQVSFDPTQYLDPVGSARLDVRWYTSGDFSMHYVEEHRDGSQWECRWDRHPNEHNERLHFHKPPDGSRVEELSLPSIHPLQMYSTVTTAIEQRIERLWDDG